MLMVVRATSMLCSVHRIITSRQREVINPLYLALVRQHMKCCMQSDPLRDILKQVQQRVIKMIRSLQHVTFEE